MGREEERKGVEGWRREEGRKKRRGDGAKLRKKDEGVGREKKGTGEEEEGTGREKGERGGALLAVPL